MKLTNKKIALCATRKIEDMINVITKLGAQAYVEDIVRIVVLSENEIIENIKRAIEESPNIFYFTTGEGANLILKILEIFGIREHLLNPMYKSRVFIRGYKTKSVLLHCGFKHFQEVDSTKSLIKTLENEDILNAKVFVQMYGEDLPELENFLNSKGAKMLKVWVYKYKADLEKVDAFIEKILNRFYDGLFFTSAYQVDYIFNRAREIGLKEELTKFLNESLIVVAIGNTTTQRLYENKVIRVYYPEKERLPFAIKEIEKAFENA